MAIYKPDKIANLVYAWEWMHVQPKVVDYISSDQVMRLIARACFREDIPMPKVRFVNSGTLPCLAHFDSWMIDIANWGRKPAVVLHEVAHLATLDAVRSGENPHGPSFVAKCIEFYHHFLSIPLEDLIDPARRSNLQIGKISMVGARAPLANSFEDVDF